MINYLRGYKRLGFTIIYLTIAVFLVMISVKGSAQPGGKLKENAFWPVIPGDSALNFNTTSGIPSKQYAKTRGSLSTFPSASVCDHNGDLLFYKTADTLRNKNNQPMPNGYYPAYGWESSQSDLILPVLDNPDQYYMLTLDESAMWSGMPVILYYSLIDMTLDNGLGDVVPGFKDKIVDSSFGGMIAATPGNNCDLWLMTHELEDTVFKAYHITEAGIDPIPVISAVGISSNSGYGGFYNGNIAISPDRSKLAMTVYPALEGTESIQLFDFNPTTGIVSNNIVLDSSFFSVFPSQELDSVKSPYGICFSPDNSKLYASLNTNYISYQALGWSFINLKMNILQFDLSNNNPDSIIQSKMVLAPNFPTSQQNSLRLGMDGKIYFGSCRSYMGLSETGMYNFSSATPFNSNESYIGSVSNPDQPGVACNVLYNAITVYHNANANINDYTVYCLGTDFVKPIPGDTIYTNRDIALCSYTDSLLLKPQYASFYYAWNDGSTDSQKVIKSPGIYWVRNSNYCHYRVDTFRVEAIDMNFDLGNDTTVCNIPSFPLVVNIAGARYLWQDGSTGNTYAADTSGIYWVKAEKKNCSQSDTINIVLKDLQQDLGPDRIYCKGEPILVNLEVTVSSGNTVQWSTGDTQKDIMVTEAGSYWVTVSDSPCTFTDSIVLITDTHCECILNIPTAFSPNGDGLNDIFIPAMDPACPTRNFKLNIYNRFGQRIYSGTEAARGWDGKQNGLYAETGIYFYELEFEGGTKNKSYYRKGDLTLIR